MGATQGYQEGKIVGLYYYDGEYLSDFLIVGNNSNQHFSYKGDSGKLIFEKKSRAPIAL